MEGYVSYLNPFIVKLENEFNLPLLQASQVVPAHLSLRWTVIGLSEHPLTRI